VKKNDDPYGDKQIADDVLREKGFWDEGEIQKRVKKREDAYCNFLHAEYKNRGKK